VPFSPGGVATYLSSARRQNTGTKNNRSK
jgi:hypothetical protein